MRIFLQNLDNDLINYGMEHRLIKEEDLVNSSMGQELKLNITEKAQRFLMELGKSVLF